MKLTYEEAKKKLLDQGYVGNPTPESLVIAGWDPTDSIAETIRVGSLMPTVVEEKITTDLAALHEEMKSNSIPANVLPILKRVVGFAVKAL